MAATVGEITLTIEALREAYKKNDDEWGMDAGFRLLEIALLDLHRIADAMETLAKSPKL